MAFLYVILFAVLFKMTEETPIKPGASGRYCDYRACVTVAYANNYTEMGCDNDGGIFPTCDHDQDYCYYSGDTRICCCNSDHCNDCSLHPGHCFNPRGVKWQKDCYFFNETLSAFIIAEEMCNNLGGHLSSIHDGFTNNFIAQNAAYYFHGSTTVDLWIGGSDMISLGNWSWTDGSPFIFTEWNHGKNATGEDCLAQSFNDGRWNAVDCFKAKPYACTVPL
uniref:C-type lectin domain-containing protein n=1 Tax=Panagrolaimus sp. PS1159 TaxID=55785 RepID=A0AC35G9S5_9BILA